MQSILYQMLILIIVGTQLTGCHQSEPPPPKTTLTIYSGITMINPLRVLKQDYEKAHPDVQIKIIQGASGFLWEDLLKERQGDIYFPGSENYRKNYEQFGILKDYVFVGYNRIALVVPKGNPKKITDDLHQLTDPNLSIVLSAPTAGSIGKATKQLLDKLKITDSVYQNTTYFTTDSHRLNHAVVIQEADIAVNWYATAKWPDSKNDIDVIQLSPELAPPKRLELNLLSFSKHPDLAKSFMRFCASQHGLQTFYDYGFFTEQELADALNDLKEQHEK